MPIDPTDPRPAYVQVANELRAAIGQGLYQPGDQLPAVRALVEEHGVSHMTVRQAIGLLRNEGLVDARQGRGVFVRTPASLRRLGSDRYARRRRQHGETPFMVDTGHLGPPTFERIAFGAAPASSEVADRLGLDDGEPVLVTSLRFHAGGQVMQISSAYIPYALVAGSPMADPGAEPWNADTITNLEGVDINVTEITEDIRCRPPSADEAASLNLAPTTPVLAITRTMYAGDRPVETCDIVVPSNRYLLSYRFPVPE
jgi:GntR family transcriptional regulator